MVHGWYHHTRAVGAPEGRPPSRPGCSSPAPRASCSPTPSPCWASPPPTGCDPMSLLVVGSIALDSIFTPFGETADALGGSAVYFSVAGLAAAPGAGGRRGRQRLSGRRARAARRPRDRLVRRRARRGRELPLEGEVLLRPAEPGDAGDPARRVRRLPAQAPGVVPLGRVSSSSATSIPSSSSASWTQVERPELVVCDTMNYWIQGKKAALLELLRRVDVLMVNDSEARELSGDWNIHRAGRWILRARPQARGDQAGRVRCAADRARAARSTCRPSRWRRCSTPPARATRSPAGSWRYLARTASVAEDNIRRAMVYGAAMGSYAVEQFGIRGFDQVTLGRRGAPGARVPGSHPRRAGRGAAVTAASTPPPASISTAPRRPRQRIGELVAGTRTALSVGKVGAFGGMVRVPPGMRQPDAGAEHRRRRHQGAGRAPGRAGSIRWARTWSITASTTSWFTAPRRSRSWTTSPARGSSVEQIAGIVEGIARGCRAHGMALAGGETAQMPGLYQAGTFDLAGTIVGVVEEDEALHGDAIRPGRRAPGLCLDRASHQRLHAGAPHRLRADGARPRRRLGDTGERVADALARGAPELLRRHPAGARPGAWPGAHHRRRDPRQPGPGAAGRTAKRWWTRRAGSCRRSSPRCNRRGRSRTDEMRDVFNLGVGMIAVLPPGAVVRRAGGRGSDGVATWVDRRDPPRRPRGALQPPLSGGRADGDGSAPSTSPGGAGDGCSRIRWSARWCSTAARSWAKVARRVRRRAHAEPVALAAAGSRARGATLVVTLEPCAHQGKQPPCTDAILRAGVRRVVAALPDPNPVAAGGAALLREAGVAVEVGPASGTPPRRRTPSSSIGLSNPRAAVRRAQAGHHARWPHRRSSRGARAGSPARTRATTSTGFGPGSTRSRSADAPRGPTIHASPSAARSPRGSPPSRVIFDAGADLPGSLGVIRSASGSPHVRRDLTAAPASRLTALERARRTRGDAPEPERRRCRRSGPRASAPAGRRRRAAGRRAPRQRAGATGSTGFRARSGWASAACRRSRDFPASRSPGPSAGGRWSAGRWARTPSSCWTGARCSPASSPRWVRSARPEQADGGLELSIDLPLSRAGGGGEHRGGRRLSHRRRRSRRGLHRPPDRALRSSAPRSGSTRPGGGSIWSARFAPATRLGGHLVQGHVDGVGTVERVARHADARLIDIRVPDGGRPDLDPAGLDHGGWREPHGQRDSRAGNDPDLADPVYFTAHHAGRAPGGRSGPSRGGYDREVRGGAGESEGRRPKARIELPGRRIRRVRSGHRHFAFTLALHDTVMSMPDLRHHRTGHRRPAQRQDHHRRGRRGSRERG